ncbi:hypothetical protein V1512DRAFT_256009 [Lipomyces arxii]|uniref:uncharacterized protein n=1 Tax=Lipomyces arxii TaxID=56418 RepID=UPI0034CF3916
MVFVARIARSNLVRNCYRTFRTSALNNAASNFAMPALSPTMTEGGISAWKVKEGEAFSAGDIILEVETDKAQMDVEAQDDGILVKIIENDGAKEIPVGNTIGIIAEPGDDIATLTLPDPVKKGSAPAAEPTPVPASAPAKAASPAPAAPSTSKSAAPKKAAPVDGSKADPNQVLFPSVLGILEANHISTEDALKNISASGPKGRITKGDVLAYLGTVQEKKIKDLVGLIKGREKLDLSNIKIAEPKPNKTEEKVPEKPVIQKPKVIINFDELLTFNPPRRKSCILYPTCGNLAYNIAISKVVIRPPQVVETIIQPPAAPVAHVGPPTPVAPVEAVEAASVAVAAPIAPKKLSRFDEIFYELVAVPKTKSL